MMDLDENREKFLKYFDQYIACTGAKDLRSWLTHSDFFKAPASIHVHSNFPGGLCLHSILVFEELKKMCERDALDRSNGTELPSAAEYRAIAVA